MGLTAGRLAGWLGDEILVDFKNFKILYRSDLDCTVQCYYSISNAFQTAFVNKAYFKACFVLSCEKFLCHFSCQSLLLSTSVLNDCNDNCM